MDKVIKIKCPCGQTTHLVKSAEGLRYDEKKHGNNELCRGRCFNCQAAIKTPETRAEAEAKAKAEVAAKVKAETKAAAAATAAKAEAKAAAEADAENTDEPAAVSPELSEMNKEELKSCAQTLGLEVPILATKAKIIQMIEEKRDADTANE